MCDIMEKDIVKESCVGAIADLTRKEQTDSVLEAEKALEQMLFDVRMSHESEIDFDATMKRIAALGATM